MSTRSASPELTVGLDDTDMPGTRGTGRLARSVAAELEDLGLGASTGVTRHQLFEGPGVPKTAHNSAAAIGLSDPAEPARVQAAVRAILLREHIPGSDPGLAVLEGPPTAAAAAFALRACRELVGRSEAERVAAREGVLAEGLAGTREGIIGALAAAGLRAGGNDGRYVGLPGIRDLSGVLMVAEILESTGIRAVLRADGGGPLPGEVRLDTGDWVRPRLKDGIPVLVARPGDEEGVWVNADARPHRG